MSFHLFKCCSNFINPDAIYWSFVNSSRYSMIPFILFIHQLFHVFLPLIFSPFLVYNHFTWCSIQTVLPVISCLSFTICFAIQKISVWWLGSFKSLARSFCFFPFAKEIILFAFCLLLLYSIHVSVNVFFFSNFHTFSSFPLLHGPFDNPHVTCAVSIIIFFICCHC